MVEMQMPLVEAGLGFYISSDMHLILFLEVQKMWHLEKKQALEAVGR